MTLCPAQVLHFFIGGILFVCQSSITYAGCADNENNFSVLCLNLLI